MAKALMIIFDSLRKDVFDRSCHPLLESWRAEGTAFENCYSQSGFTLISFSSILTGCFPSRTTMHLKRPACYSQGRRGRQTDPVWWWLEDAKHTHLVLEETRSIRRSALSLFENKLLTIDYSKTNAFLELTERQMLPSLEYGSAFTAFYDRFRHVGSQDDFLMVIRIFDTHLPYGRGVSGCDAPTVSEIKKKVASLYSLDNGRTLLEDVAVKALERALDYLNCLWRWISPRLDFAAIMSDHGDQWSSAPHKVGHGRFLSRPVLRVPLIVVDKQRSGRCNTPCNNVDVLATLLATCGKKADWKMDGRKLNDPPSQPFCTEANSLRGEFTYIPERESASLLNDVEDPTPSC